MAFHEGYLEFVRLFNERRYHEGHEALLDVWRINPANRFYKGMIQLAGAFDHWESGSYYWAENLFRSAAELLRPFGPHHMGLNLEKLIPMIETCGDVAAQQRRDRDRAYKLPPLTLELEEPGA